MVKNWLFGIIASCSTLFSLPVAGQLENIINEFSLPQDALWMVDGLDNVIVANKDKLTKYNPQGKVLFEQSHKANGMYDKIEMVNSLKFYAFSEDQQIVAFFDNSLSRLEQSIDLSDYDIINANLVASSVQSDKIWVYDQVNTNLHLIAMNGELQSQEIKNLRGILGYNSIHQMSEIDGRLYLVDSTKGVYILDHYGTLINFVETKGVRQVMLYKGLLFLLKDRQIAFYGLRDAKLIDLAMTFKEDVTAFYVNSTFLYFRIGDKLVKTQVEFLD